MEDKLYVKDPTNAPKKRLKEEIVMLSEVARLMFCPEETSIWVRNRTREKFVVPRQYVIYTLNYLMGHSQPSLERAFNELYGNLALKRIAIWHNMNKCRDLIEVERAYYENFMEFIAASKSDGFTINGELKRLYSKFNRDENAS